MDLTTLITACTIMADPKVMHALIWRQSGGEPWAFSVAGQQQTRILQSMKDAVIAAQAIRPDDIAIRVGLAGLPSTPRFVTATMFTPCANVTAAARQLAQLVEFCMTSSRAKGDPIHCAVAAYHGSWERPDNSFADAVNTTVAEDDAPDFEMPEDADPGASRQPASYGTAPPPTPPRLSKDYERARESPLFVVMAKSFEHAANNSPAGEHSAGDRSGNEPSRGDRSAGQEHRPDVSSTSATDGQPHMDSVFVARSMQGFPFKSE
jgi:hypothetical protein